MVYPATSSLGEKQMLEVA